MIDLSAIMGDDEHGWKSARNPLKVLNHLAFLRGQEAAAKSGDWAQLAMTRHLEFHPTDRCMLACKGCTYESLRSDRMYPFSELARLAWFNPLSMVIVGGGEPTLYTDGSHRFGDIVQVLREIMPTLRMALITNGVVIPGGDWQRELSWVRVSLDAATPETYAAFKGVSAFENVVENVMRYLQSGIQNVGVGFLYSKWNVHEYAAVARLLYERATRESPALVDRLNIQYRPLTDDAMEATHEDDVTDEQALRAIEDTIRLAGESVAMRRFLTNQTNITAIQAGNSHKPQSFDRCFYAEMFKMVRPDGEVRPCCIRVDETDTSLGNILTDSLESIGKRTADVARLTGAHCRPETCRWGKTNRLLAEGLAGRITPSQSPDVRNDPMF